MLRVLVCSQLAPVLPLGGCMSMWVVAPRVSSVWYIGHLYCGSLLCVPLHWYTLQSEHCIWYTLQSEHCICYTLHSEHCIWYTHSQNTVSGTLTVRTLYHCIGNVICYFTCHYLFKKLWCIIVKIFTGIMAAYRLPNLMCIYLTDGSRIHLWFSGTTRLLPCTVSHCV